MKNGFNIWHLLIAFSFLTCSWNGIAQERNWFGNKEKKKPLLEVSVRKSGPYFGIQQGVYTYAELGGEMQFKKIKLKKPTTHGVYFGAEYNIIHNILGFQLGAWRKPGRFDFTYGLQTVLRSDFERFRFGVAPAVGYKVFGFHIMAGYMFHTPSDFVQEINTLYLSLRFIVVNDRKTSFKKREKKK